MDTRPNADHQAPRLSAANVNNASDPDLEDTQSAQISADTEVTALRHDVVALQWRLDHLQEELAALRSVLVPTAPMEQHSQANVTPTRFMSLEEQNVSDSAEMDDARDKPSTTTSRRDLLKWGGLGAAATLAAAGGAVLTSQTAHAADGDNLILGQSNSAEHNTALVVSINDGSLPALSINSFSTDNSIAFASVGGNHGVGVLGAASESDAFGVLGQSSAGTGVGGQSSGSGGFDVAALGTGRLWQKPSGSVGEPTIGKRGEQTRDSNGDLYICVADGLPGIWKKVAALNTSFQGGAIGLLANPIRLLDTRTNSAWVAGSTHALQVTGVSIGGISVPAGAVGVVGNVTVVRASADGDLRLYPGATVPASSSINFAARQVIANSVIVGLNGSGQFNIKVDMPTGATVNVLFDASGFIL
jgi:hypothetical protein